MKWFNNLKLRSKLLMAFLFVTMISGLLGYVGITNILDLDDSDTELYERMTVPISLLSDISTEFQRIRVLTRDVILADDPIEINEYIREINSHRDQITQLSGKFKERIISEEMRTAYEDSKTQ